MTSVVVERFGEATSRRDRRALDLAVARTLEALAERTVWCATASTRVDASARALRDHVGWAVGARLLALRRGGEALTREGVTPDDVVVLHDADALGIAGAIREGGAHVLLRVGIGMRAGAGPPIDAYLLSWQSGRFECLAAVVPSTATLAERDIPLAQTGSERRRDLAWASLLSDVARTDRHETVGGVIHARPLVAAR